MTPMRGQPGLALQHPGTACVSRQVPHPAAWAPTSNAHGSIPHTATLCCHPPSHIFVFFSAVRGQAAALMVLCPFPNSSDSRSKFCSFNQ